MRTVFRTFTFYVFGTLLTLAAFFAVIELTTRTVSWVRGDGFGLALHELDATDSAVTEIYQFHPFTGFIFRPDRVFVAGHPDQEELTEIRTDEHGFLSATGTLPIAKSADEIRIATIGASTTANVNLTFEQNWPGRLGDLVQQALPDKRVTVINAGIPGFNTAQSIGNLALRVMPFKPDLVVIYHAYNDLKVVRPGFEPKPDYSNVHERPYGEHERPNILLRLLDKSMFYVRTRNGYRKYQKTKAAVAVIAGTNRLDAVPEESAAIFEHNIRMLIACARGGGAKVILSSFATLHDLDDNYDSGVLGTDLTPLKRQELHYIMHFTPGLSLNGIFDGLARYNKLLQEIAAEQDTGWVDNAKLIAHRDENFVDRVHFSREGAERMAQNFLPVALDQLSGAAALSDVAATGH